MGLIATSITLIATWPLGGELYGAELTVTGRSFGFNCHAARFLGLRNNQLSMLTRDDDDDDDDDEKEAIPLTRSNVMKAER